MYNWFVIRDSFVETPSIQGFKRELTNSKNFRYDDWLNTNLLILCSRLFAPWLWWKSFQQHTFILCISMYIDRMIPEFLRSALPDLGTARRGRSTVTGSRVIELLKYFCGEILHLLSWRKDLSVRNRGSKSSDDTLSVGICRILIQMNLRCVKCRYGVDKYFLYNIMHRLW